MISEEKIKIEKQTKLYNIRYQHELYGAVN
jgi:hypothetical protein